MLTQEDLLHRLLEITKERNPKASPLIFSSLIRIKCRWPCMHQHAWIKIPLCNRLLEIMYLKSLSGHGQGQSWAICNAGPWQVWLPLQNYLAMEKPEMRCVYVKTFHACGSWFGKAPKSVCKVWLSGAGHFQTLHIAAVSRASLCTHWMWNVWQWVRKPQHLSRNIQAVECVGGG